MPTVLKIGPYRLYFYSNESAEPAHIHIDRDNMSAKFWIKDIRLARNIGFDAHELNRIYKMVIENQEILLEAWYGYFGNTGR
ncbi:MAG: DUF4160 domain-containing protein [Phycisphaerae bacterium]|nr:DUF4160 domain-containing protein [Phycisphaerae bacterium]